jgi:hypothetical protein
MQLSADDRLSIHELINRHGHICDAGAFERFEEIMTPDVVYDVSRLGGEVMLGIDQVRSAAITLGEGNPIAHHVTNIVFGLVEADGVEVVSKGLGLSRSGSTASVVYHDKIVRTSNGWRIAHRQVLLRQTPLEKYALPDAPGG